MAKKKKGMSKERVKKNIMKLTGVSEAKADKAADKFMKKRKSK